MEKHKGKKFVMFIVLAPIAVVGIGYGFMWLWNWLIPSLFSGPLINFWQAVGLIALSKILFGGCHSGRKCKCCNSGGGSIGGNWRKKWESMPEEKKEKMKAYCKTWSNMNQESTTTKPEKDENSN